MSSVLTNSCVGDVNTDLNLPGCGLFRRKLVEGYAQPSTLVRTSKSLINVAMYGNTLDCLLGLIAHQQGCFSFPDQCCTPEAASQVSRGLSGTVCLFMVHALDNQANINPVQTMLRADPLQGSQSVVASLSKGILTGYIPRN